jgi:aryl-alcohol dehydrogenase-like predicted oxidoreductase
MSVSPGSRPADASGTFVLGDRTVNRLGYGTMQLPGPGVWGPSRDRGESIRVLRRAVELGVTLIDTADSYGPHVADDLLREALHPYPDELVIATKAGLTRSGPGQWASNGRPEHLRASCEDSLQRLGLDTIQLFQLHRIDPRVPAEDQFGTLRELRDEGKIQHAGLSEVSIASIEAAREVLPIATVQNMYNLADRQSEDVLEHCEREGLGFIPWFPIASGRLADAGGPVARVAAEQRATPAQVALAWLLARSPVILPIPGTSRVAHLEQNCAAAHIELSEADIAILTRQGRG